MAVTQPPEASAAGPQPPVTPPMLEPAPPTPPMLEPPAPPTPPAYSDSPPPRRPRGTVAGLILIALGVVALLSMWFPGGGAWLFLGLGVAFAVARLTTGKRGYAIPAGVLLGFGSYVWCTETGLLSGDATGGTFFILLGLGFLAAYAIAARPTAVWPLVPALALIAFGVALQMSMMGTSLTQFWWLAQYWPLAIVAVGTWLLIRDRIPEEVHTPLAVVGGTVLVLLGLLVAASGMAGVMSGYTGLPMPMFRPWPTFGGPTLQDTVTLTAHGAAVDTVRVVNTSGQTTVRRADTSEIRVQATRHYANPTYAPDVRLVPANRVLTIGAAPESMLNAYVDYTIDVPAGVGADLRSASGDIDVRNLSGDLSAQTASGAIRVFDTAGDVQLTSASGSISATGVDRLTQSRSISGGINLSGAFREGAQISSTSGDVVVHFAAPSTVGIDASSVSGDVTGDLGLANRTTGPHRLVGALGGGGPTVTIRTTSGDIRLLRGA